MRKRSSFDLDLILRTLKAPLQTERHMHRMYTKNMALLIISNTRYFSSYFESFIFKEPITQSISIKIVINVLRNCS